MTPSSANPMIESNLVDMLACPTCKTALRADASELVCAGCNARYDARGAVPDLIPAELRTRLREGGDASWERWREAIRGLETWRARRLAGARDQALPSDGADDESTRAFLREAGVKGRVVDVGAKDGGKRALLPDGVQYLGVDPFAAPAIDLPPGARLVRGVAEALPVRERAADAVVSFAAFDYFVDGERALAEMARVLVPGGTLALLVSVVSATVAHARGARSRRMRVTSAFRAVREVGLAAGVGLMGAALTEADRPHTHYYTRSAVLGLVGQVFDVETVRDRKQDASTILYVVARKKRNTRLRVIG